MDNKHNKFVESLRNIMRNESTAKHCDLAKVKFESVTGVCTICYIDMSDTPIEIVRKFIDENPKEAAQFFSCQSAINFFLRGSFDECRSSFDLLDIKGDSIKGNWRFSLRDQAEIVEEMKNIRNQGQVPTFVFTVSIYAA